MTEMVIYVTCGLVIGLIGGVIGFFVGLNCE